MMLTDKIYVFDGLVKDFNFDYLEFARIPTEQSRVNVWTEDPSPNIYKSKRLYEAGTGWIKQTPDICLRIYDACLEGFYKINPNCEIIEFKHCLFNIINKNNVMNEKDIHVDDDQILSWSAACHLYGSGGPTEFYSKKDKDSLISSVDFVPGRIVFFPARYLHKFCTPETGIRMSLGHMFTIKGLE